jgi:outer membrane immunogenic protein
VEASLRHSLFLSALLAGTMATTAGAMAADDMPPEFRSSTFDIYVGAFGSANMLQSKFEETDATGAPTGYLDGNAFGFGLRGGVDYIMDGWVLGAVGDWSFGVGERMARDGEYESELNMPNLGTIRARAGYTAGPAVFYVTGGYAQAEMELTVDSIAAEDPGSDWTSGWTLGGGVDVALTDQLTMGLEYLYLSLDDVNYRIDTDTDSARYRQELDALHSIRLGVNYAFSI